MGESKISLAKIWYSLIYKYKKFRIQNDGEFMEVWESIDRVQGHLVSPYQEHWLFRVVQQLPEKANIVEIGSYKGRSTISMAYGIRGSKKQIYAIDTFDGNDGDFLERNFYHEFVENLTCRNLSDRVSPMQCYSYEAARTWNKPINFLFIDGSHKYEDVLSDFDNFYPHVVKDGIIAIHDVVYTWGGPLKAWEEKIKGQLKNIGFCETLAYGKK